MLTAGVCVLILFTGTSCAVTTANITVATMASEVDSVTQEAVIATDTFGQNTPEIFCSVEVANAPDETKLKGSWYYMEDGDTEIDSYTLDVEGTSVASMSLIKPTKGWPVGSYELRLYIDDKLEETKSFTVQ